MLQLFIMTGNRPLLNFSQAFLNNIPEPLPIDQKSSMMVRSELIFDDVLPQSLKNNGWSMRGVRPKEPNGAWSGQLTDASVNASVNLKPLDRSKPGPWAPGGLRTTITTKYSIPGGNTVAWSLDGTTWRAEPNGQISYEGSPSQSLAYKERRCTKRNTQKNADCSEKMHSTDVTVNVSAVLPLSVGGTGREQTVNIDTKSQGVPVDGHLSGGGPSGKDDLEARVNQEIQKQIPGQLAPKLTFKFEPISVFALKNLLFPSGNYIHFSSAAVPGDLLLLGNFTS